MDEITLEGVITEVGDSEPVRILGEAPGPDSPIAAPVPETGLRVAYVGAFLYPTGYGEACRSHVKALKSRGATVMAQLNERIPLGLRHELIRDEHAVNQMLDTKFWPVDRTVDAWVWHVTPDAMGRSGDGKPNYNYAVWEVEGLPPGWADAVNARSDGLLTCSDFSAHLFREGGVTKPIEVSPHPIDLDRFNPEVDGGPLRGLFPQADTLFLVVGQWMYRKGIEDVLVAYGSEFSPEDRVGLVLLTWRWSHAVSEKRTVKAYTREVLSRLNVPVPPVWVITDKLPQGSLPKLYRACDALVSASRGEAFGLPAFEAAACGRPTISTGYGGMWDFLSEESAYPVACDMQTVHGLGPKWRHYTARQKWGRPRLDDLRRAMREAHEDREGRERRGRAAFEAVAERLSYPVAGRRMVEAIGSLIDKSRSV